jgi:hypothetical protein
LCSEHQRLFDQGFIALVECDPERSGRPGSGDRIQPDQVYRTGRIAHLKREAFDRVFTSRLHVNQPCVFVEPAVIEKLQSSVGSADEPPVVT